MEFNSILGEEMLQYLILRKGSCSKSTYDHDKQVLKSFDCFLQSAGCTSKEIVWRKWVPALPVKNQKISRGN